MDELTKKEVREATRLLIGNGDAEGVDILADAFRRHGWDGSEGWWRAWFDLVTERHDRNDQKPTVH